MDQLGGRESKSEADEVVRRKCEEVLDSHVRPALGVWNEQLPEMLLLIPIYDPGKEPSISIKTKDGYLNKLQFRCNGEFLEIWTTLGGHRSGAEIPLSQISVELIADKISLFVEKLGSG